MLGQITKRRMVKVLFLELVLFSDFAWDRVVSIGQQTEFTADHDMDTRSIDALRYSAKARVANGRSFWLTILI